MKYLHIVDWGIHQSYRKDRGTPPWIKIHRTLLSSQNWSALSDAEKGQLVSIWMIGADRKGEIPADPCVLRKVCILDKTPNINKFIELGYLEPNGCQDDNHVPTINGNLDAPEAEAEAEAETETEKHFGQKAPSAPGREGWFEIIWGKYPRKLKKHIASLKFKKQVQAEQDWLDIQQALKNYIHDTEHIRANGHPDREWMHGSTWFNHVWKDYVEMAEIKAETFAERIKRRKEAGEI